eukprot:TRINITY_DN2660_c0_g1_i1.p1 TRINITY_DN2660_c0_g1~~TRINITY_DN2660_c0_g1_i1.p1  ORF type:complete len:242 (-),score=55.59 TRINITY_DN2660_c0_g1_i1:91-816(-)
MSSHKTQQKLFKWSMIGLVVSGGLLWFIKSTNLLDKMKALDQQERRRNISGNAVFLSANQLQEKISAVKITNPELFAEKQPDTPLDTALNFHVSENKDIEFNNPLILHIDGKLFTAKSQIIEANSKDLLQQTTFTSEPTEIVSYTIANRKLVEALPVIRKQPFHSEKNQERETKVYDSDNDLNYSLKCETQFYKDKENNPVNVTRAITYHQAIKTSESLESRREKWLKRLGCKKQGKSENL